MRKWLLSPVRLALTCVTVTKPLFFPPALDCTHLSLPTSLPFNQRALRSWPPQPFRWLACPESLLVQPPPCCSTAEPAFNIGCWSEMLRCDYKERSSSMMLSHVFYVFSVFLRRVFFLYIYIASAYMICPRVMVFLSVCSESFTSAGNLFFYWRGFFVLLLIIFLLCVAWVIFSVD